MKPIFVHVWFPHVVSPCGVPITCPHVVSPCGVPMWWTFVVFKDFFGMFFSILPSKTFTTLLCSHLREDRKCSPSALLVRWRTANPAMKLTFHSDQSGGSINWERIYSECSQVIREFTSQFVPDPPSEPLPQPLTPPPAGSPG